MKKTTVYFVDEDSAAYAAWTAELEFRGLEAKTIRTADRAFRELQEVDASDVGLVVIDVMLAVENPDDPRFSLERTDSYLETGLCLLEDLADANPDVFPRAAVLLSNTITETTLEAATRTSKRFEVPFWQKADIESPLEFGDRVMRELEPEELGHGPRGTATE